MGRVGNFEVQGELERGSGFATYRALHVVRGEPVVLKVLLCGATAAPEVRQRFVNEGSRLTRLDHPCVQRVVEVGEAEGQPYVAMQPVDARRIGTLLQQRTDPLPPLTAAQIACHLAGALEHCHAEGVVHRDVSMGSVLLAPDGRPVLTDFGVTKDLDPNQAGVAQTGRCMGTPGYSSPEQASGQMSRIGPSVDIYGLGAVLYTMLVRQTPIQGNSPMGILARTLSQVPVPPRTLRPEIPADLEAVCLRCLAKAPEQRYASAGDLRGALEEVVGSASRASPPVRLVNPSRAPASLEETADDEGFEEELVEAARVAGVPPSTPRATATARGRGPGRRSRRGGEGEGGSRGPSPVALGLGAVVLLALIGVGGFFAAGSVSDEPLVPETPPSQTEDPPPEPPVGVEDPASSSGGDQARLYLEEGIEKLAGLKFRGALSAFEKAIELDPSLALAFHGRGNVQFALGNPEAALKDYEKAIELAPDAAEPHHNRGAAAERLDRTADAMSAYERFLELAPGHPQAAGVRADLARLRETLGD